MRSLLTRFYGRALHRIPRQIVRKFLRRYLLSKSSGHIAPLLNFTDLLCCVGFDEFLRRNVSAADPDKHLASFFNFDVDFLLSELVDAVGLAQEEYLQPIFLWVLVYDIGERLVDLIILLCNIENLVRLVLPFYLKQLGLVHEFHFLEFLLQRDIIHLVNFFHLLL